MVLWKTNNFTFRYVHTQPRGCRTRGFEWSTRRSGNIKGAKRERKRRWLSSREDLKEAGGFPSRTEAAIRFLSSTSLPIPFHPPPPPLPFSFLPSNRWLHTAQLGPSCLRLPSAAASPRPGPGAGPGPSRSPAPCRSASRRLRLGYWQRDNLPYQQKKPECATENLSGAKTYRNKKKRKKNRQRPKTERRDGEGTRPRKVVFFSCRF